MPDENLIPTNWFPLSGNKLTLPGDKYWSSKHLAWLPITVNSEDSNRPVWHFLAVIREVRTKW